MCTNYRPASIESFRAGVLDDLREHNVLAYKKELYPLEPGPIIRHAHDADAATSKHVPEWTPAQFGLVPSWVKEENVAKMGRMAYNARAETVAAKPMFRGAWSGQHYCLIPADAFF